MDLNHIVLYDIGELRASSSSSSQTQNNIYHSKLSDGNQCNPMNLSNSTLSPCRRQSVYISYVNTLHYIRNKELLP